MPIETKIVNLSYLIEMSEGDNTIIKEMIDIFKTQVDEFKTEMDQLFNNSEWLHLGMLAHKAKSSIAIMGMEKLAVELKELEILAKRGEKTETYKMYIESFNLQCDLALKELKEVYKSL